MSITAPFNLVAVAVSPTQVNLTWGPSTTGGGGASDIQPGDISSGDIIATAGSGIPTITTYQIYRNNVLISMPGNVLAFSDKGLSPNTTYSYKVNAVDSASEVSGFSNTAVATPFVPPKARRKLAAQDIVNDQERRRILYELRLVIQWHNDRIAAMKRELELAAIFANMPRRPKKEVHPMIGLLRANREERDQQAEWQKHVEEYQLLNPWFFGA